MHLFVFLTLPRKDQSRASATGAGSRVQCQNDGTIEVAATAIVIRFTVLGCLRSGNERFELLRRFAQNKPSRILIPRGFLAADAGRPHQIQRRLKVNLNMKIATTFHGKTDEDTWILRMRRNTLSHAEGRCSVDAGHAEGIDLD